MSSSRPNPPLRAAVTAGLACAAALVVVATLALALVVHSSADGVGPRLANAADGLVPAASATDQVRLERNADRARVAAVVREASGATVIAAGPQGLFRAPAADLLERVSAGGGDRWELRDGTVTAERQLPSGRVLVVAMRAPGVGIADGTYAAVYGTAGGISVVLGVLVGLMRRRIGRAAGRLAVAADALANGRHVSVDPSGPSDLRPVGASLVTAAERMGRLRAAAESGIDGLAAALAPLALPVAARTPAGRLIRNDALLRELSEAAPLDRGLLEGAVGDGLAGTGPMARRLALQDGRVLEMEAWSVPGGRLVSIGERTESERLQNLRRQLEGVAARHLGAPVAEIKALGSDLLSSAPAAAAPAVARIMSAADRMERLVASLLRGTPHDPHSRPLDRHPVGVAGFLWGLSHAWDRGLRPQALRVELAVEPDLPALLTDASLAEEILVELIENAAKFSQRGGTITLAARNGAEGTVALEVRDTGGGFRADEVAHVRERFFRGRDAVVLPGAGLGLGVASALAERLGGRLEVESGPGGLARLVLPAAPAPRTVVEPVPTPAAEPAPAEAAEAEETREPVGSGSR